MNTHLKRQHSIDEKSEVLDSKTVKTSPGTRVREFSLLQGTLSVQRSCLPSKKKDKLFF